MLSLFRRFQRRFPVEQGLQRLRGLEPGERDLAREWQKNIDGIEHLAAGPGTREEKRRRLAANNHAQGSLSFLDEHATREIDCLRILIRETRRGSRVVAVFVARDDTWPEIVELLDGRLHGGRLRHLQEMLRGLEGIDGTAARLPLAPEAIMADLRLLLRRLEGAGGGELETLRAQVAGMKAHVG
jgi:hypothetical protein